MVFNIIILGCMSTEQYIQSKLYKKIRVVQFYYIVQKSGIMEVFFLHLKAGQYLETIIAGGRLLVE